LELRHGTTYFPIPEQQHVLQTVRVELVTATEQPRWNDLLPVPAHRLDAVPACTALGVLAGARTLAGRAVSLLTKPWI